MKQILGDNQFFGINHYDIKKGDITKSLFSDNESVISFIYESYKIGLIGCMINSNNRGYDITNTISNSFEGEIHYSVPYPHKFASMVNENGMIFLLSYVIRSSSFSTLFINFPKFLVTRNVKHILPLILDLEIPKKLKKGSYVYLQNIVTDLILGMKRYDLLESFCNLLIEKGYVPGIITLNPILMDQVISKFDINIQKKIILCFNINNTGFNVFPSLDDVKSLVYKETNYKKMGMSILSSGGTNNITDSLKFIKSLPLDYVVYGSSNLENIYKNYIFLSSVK
jgi:hypothetical protein